MREVLSGAARPAAVTNRAISLSQALAVRPGPGAQGECVESFRLGDYPIRRAGAADQSLTQSGGSN